MDIVMLGPQGSGKGTQSALLSEKYAMPHVSLGTLFRTEVAMGTDIGKEISEYISRGDIVPSAIATKAIADRLSKGDAANGVILDGYPRTLEQADALDNIMGTLGRKVSHVVYLNVSDAQAMHRLGGRRVCTNTACERNYHLELMPPKVPDVCDRCQSPLKKRVDDTPEAIAHRLAIYHNETAPLIALYAGLGLLREINGEKPIGEVQAAIAQAIGKA